MAHCLGHRGPVVRAHQKPHWLPGVGKYPDVILDSHWVKYRFPQIAASPTACLDTRASLFPWTLPDSWTFLTVWGASQGASEVMK